MPQKRDTQKEAKSIRRHLEATCMVLVMTIVARFMEAIQPVPGAQHHRLHQWEDIPSVEVERRHLEATCMVLVMVIVVRYIGAIQHHQRHQWKDIPSV